MGDFFTTPIYKYDLDLPNVNQELSSIFLEEAIQNNNIRRSNAGGWHSPYLEERKEKPFVILRTTILAHFNLMLTKKIGVKWKYKWDISSWVIVNWENDYNMPHTHSMCEWSSSYYIDAGDSVEGDDKDKVFSGHLMFHDPRGGLIGSNKTPAYADDLYHELYGNNTISFKPATGSLYIFPAWLSHSVLPYKGERPRIVYSTNFSLRSSQLS